MHYLTVKIKRNETAKLSVQVSPWELPILRGKHGGERIEVGALVDFPNRPWPTDAASEMNRLNRLYGVTGAGDGAPTFAERAYGSDEMGIEALAVAMAKAQKDAGMTKAPARKAGRPRKTDLIGAQASA